MWHRPNDLHNVSLRFMRRLMHWLLLLPPNSQWQMKVVYKIIFLAYLTFILNWRFSFNYMVIYDFCHDHFSRMLDLVNYVTLTATHAAITIEVLWLNRTEQIEQQLEHIRQLLLLQFGCKMNLARVRRYCNLNYMCLIVRLLALTAMTLYCNLNSNPSVLLYYGLYSELVLLMRLSEFNLYATLIMAFYMELHDISNCLRMELNWTRFRIWSARRTSLKRLCSLQQLHGLLWQVVRCIEDNFAWSLILLMLKYFVDTSVMPYWIYINIINDIDVSMVYYCITEDLCKLCGIILSCLICTRCALLQQQLRAMFHGLLTDRHSRQLNYRLLSISRQLSQECCQFSASGLLLINNETLGKFLFGMVTYIVICIQFRKALIAKTLTDAVVSTISVSQLP
ncbi:putative gustatory receptor 98a [Drosophila busckii]|uniref:putative gustatory receptor 98a n=1 Tax=Drosophila busckii TaxID=30019 RepID=UPI001433058F|nr:putative gustatory receptor 98a [Drosophila busckii]